MTRAVRALAVLLGALLAGCSTMKVATRQLAAEVFLRLYSHPGTPGDYWEYKGLNNGRYWLYHYGFKQPQQSVVSLLEKGYVAEQEMPNGFPSTPQPGLAAGDDLRLKEGLERWRKQAPGPQKQQ